MRLWPRRFAHYYDFHRPNQAPRRTPVEEFLINFGVTGVLGNDPQSDRLQSPKDRIK
jgi:hypothetical protein